MRTGRATLLLAVAVVFGVPTARAEEAVATPRYAGSEACIECHEDQGDSLKLTGHGKAGFAELNPHGCEGCHGPAAEHADHPKNSKLFPLIKKWPVAEQVATCRACHTGGKVMLWEGSAHAEESLSCLSCHSIHSFASERSQLKEATEMETCFACHKGIRSETLKTSHHPIREGKIGCSDCHNPHGAESDKLLAASSVNEQCFQCHAEKRGPFLWDHAPVREDCLSCHTPHGSNHAKLQTSAVPYLCQQCHANTRHPGTLYDAASLPGSSKQSNRLFDRGCVNCHAAIHGSNHPSGPYLGR